MKRINGINFYTPSEVLQQFGIGKSTLVRWRRLYHIGFIVVGRRVYYPASEIARVVNESMTYDRRPVMPPRTNAQANKQSIVHRTQGAGNSIDI